MLFSRHCDALLVSGRSWSITKYYGHFLRHTIIRAVFVCLSVCLFVPLLLRGPLMDLHQKLTSQYNINRAVTGGFLPDAYFSRSAAHRPIFLTLNHVVKSASGRLTAAARRLFGHQSISSGNDQIFGRCPADDHPEAQR